ncbi:hypothetical protein GIB67_004098 [Kingdonia uniflora]|uniref:2-(3-amino-3-carboxypropyl)histidine synthase subunit 2 n=1 Tax=Kingdonia uniflora TaxID=39325 RepID=A0A7J7NR98_9MAGN|nr:hypothetical protein GIB67_004098 [Kingdonia uniflora]
MQRVPMELASNYEIVQTAHFINSRKFTRVALQFPDELLKDSTRVVSVLRDELIKDSDGEDAGRDVGLFVMADTTYGSCCVDEVGASHVNADCVIHYGHTCLSPTSTLPAFFVFGKAAINVSDCTKSISECLSTSHKLVLILYGLEYAHVIDNIKESTMLESSAICGPKPGLALHYADVMCSIMDPSKDCSTGHEKLEVSDIPGNGDCSHSEQVGSITTGTNYNIGGLRWNLPEDHKMEDYLLFWIGSDNPAFANVLLTFNKSEIVRYDPIGNGLVKDVAHQGKILMRRYYLVEKAKDANIIGILVGTLAVAGYLRMIHQMKELITRAGKKAYTLVMGRPNPAKLANFPECDVFVYVSCAQTALLDSKEFFVPVITPFEAMLAFTRGSQWTGEYVMEFRELIGSSVEVDSNLEEPRFSFLKGGYVEDTDLQESVEEKETINSLAEATQKALQLRDKYPNSLVKGNAKSGAEFFSSRSYQGLEMPSEDSSPRSFVTGRTGKAAGYKDENNKQEDL